jgi:pimeloyl-ACP methyl ester carboxylesterase
MPGHQLLVRQYARASEVHVAYQLFGTGAIDLVVLPDGFMPIEAIAEYPPYARFRYRLASFSRTIILDRRGLGFSEAASAQTSPTLEDWAEDVNAVADAVSANSVALVGIAEGAFTAVYYAARFRGRAHCEPAFDSAVNSHVD